MRGDAEALVADGANVARLRVKDRVAEVNLSNAVAPVVAGRGGGDRVGAVGAGRHRDRLGNNSNNNGGADIRVGREVQQRRHSGLLRAAVRVLEARNEGRDGVLEVIVDKLFVKEGIIFENGVQQLAAGDNNVVEGVLEGNRKDLGHRDEAGGVGVGARNGHLKAPRAVLPDAEARGDLLLLAALPTFVTALLVRGLFGRGAFLFDAKFVLFVAARI